MTTLNKHFKTFLNLFLQSNCPLCQRPSNSEFCPSCIKQIQKCQLNDPLLLPQEQMPVFAWGSYGGILKRALAVLKYNNCPEVARPLGQWLGEYWLQKSLIATKNLVVVPIPLHLSKQKTRGFNQAELIAKSFCETTGFKLKARGLRRVRETQAQHLLSLKERETNTLDAFELGQELQRHSDITVLLIDDIYTTGATARSAATALFNSEITVIGLATIAAGVKSR
jgi:ComF family protein